MKDIAPIVIKIQHLLRQTYDQFNERQYKEALASAAELQAEATELVREIEQK